MGRSVVYFTDMRATPERNLLQKFRALIERAGIADINFEKQFTAIKIHLGEPGNIAYLRPNFAKVVADKVKELGGKPFLTDSNTLYVGRRKDALEHLEAAYENGYNPFCTGCHVVIADGLKGTDEALVPVEGGEYIKEAKIGRAIADADVIISLTHFKGHEITGFGGAIKNLGMGSGSRGGKMEMHSDGKPSVDEGKCIGCGRCARNCAQKAIRITEGKAHIDHEKCVGCGRCISACPFDAVKPDWEGSETAVCRKMAEYAKAVIDRNRRKAELPYRRRRGRLALLRLSCGERRGCRAEHRLLRIARPRRARPGLRRRRDEGPRRREQLPRRPDKKARSRRGPLPHNPPRHALAGDARARREDRHRHARVRADGDIAEIS